MILMNPLISKTRIWFLLFFSVTVSFILMACEPGIDIRIHNGTDETLQIFIDDEVCIGEAPPGGEVVREIERIQPKYTFIAKDIDGNVLYTANYTRADFKGKKTFDVYFPPLEDESENSDNITGE